LHFASKTNIGGKTLKKLFSFFAMLIIGTLPYSLQVVVVLFFENTEDSFDPL